MAKSIVSVANRMKSKAGKTLDNRIQNLAKKIKSDKVIKDFESKKNFNHTGFNYKYSYKADLFITTHDGSYIVVEQKRMRLIILVALLIEY